MNRKICFVSPAAYPLLAGKNLGTAGGAEVQQALLVRELVKRGFEVSCITYSYGGAPVEDIDGIKVIKVYRREDAPGLARLAKARYVWRALEWAEAGIYLHRSGAAGIVAIFCRLKERRFIQCIASDMSINKARTAKSSRFNHPLSNWLDIKLAGTVIVQSENQNRLLKKNFGRNGVIIKNAFPLAGRDMPAKARPPVVLWVGTIAAVKQPELFLKLAESIPAARFQMIGGAGGDADYYHAIKEAAQRLPNLEFSGFVPFHEIGLYFQRASILVNTSEFEGFPNTFIQAWEQFVPAVSLNVDPDDILCRQQIGCHSQTFERLVEDVKRLLSDEPVRAKMGKEARLYAEREHSIERAVASYIKVLDEIK